jgi:hypothetical protein
MKTLPKMGRRKKDPLDGGFDENSGFWAPVLKRIGRRLVRRGAITESDWANFSGPNGEWMMLKAIACNPGLLLDVPAGHARFLCAMIVKHPVAVPLFLGMIREEAAATSDLERWLFYSCGRARVSFTDDELCERYKNDTGRTVKTSSMTQARENLYRRIGRAKRPV